MKTPDTTVPAATMPDVVPSPARNSFAQYGIFTLAYLRRIDLEGLDTYAVYAADGTRLWVEDDLDAAEAALESHGMTLVSLH